MLISEIYHPHPHTILTTATVKEALSTCLSSKINGLIVVDDQNRVMGVLSIQDMAAATVPTEFKANTHMAAAMYKKGYFHEMCQHILSLPVTKVMRKKFETVSLSDNILAITAEFLQGDLYLVPVIEKKQLVGVVTRSEIKHALAFGMGILTEKQLLTHRKMIPK